MRNLAHILALSTSCGVLLGALSACNDDHSGNDENATGKTAMALSSDLGIVGDAEAVRYTVTRVSCGGELFDSFNQSADVPLMGFDIIGGAAGMEWNPLADGAEHSFADLLIAVPSGCYDIVAQPITSSGANSAVCSAASLHGVFVEEGKINELVLISQCQNEDTVTHGDIVTIFNTSPAISGIAYAPNKHVPECQEQTICVTAIDPEGDPLEFQWSLSSGEPPQSGPTLARQTVNPDGSVTECRTILPGTAGGREFTVKVFDLMQDPSGAGMIRFEDYFALIGAPRSSHAQYIVPSYAHDAPSICEAPMGTGGAGGSGGSGSSSSSGSSTGSSSSGSSSGSGGSGGNGSGGGSTSGGLVCQDPGRVWHFGNHDGLYFTSIAPQWTRGYVDARGGTAVLSCGDTAVISTDGNTVYDSTGQVMANGDMLVGGRFGPQPALLVPRPGTKEVFLFTINDLGGREPLHYSVIDMNLQNGLGAIDPMRKNLSLASTIPVAEQMTSAKHQNGVDTWVIVRARDVDGFLAFLVGAQGITGPVSSIFGTTNDGIQGELAASPNGLHLAMGGYQTEIQLYDFNPTTGQVSNPMVVPGTCHAYGVEFSPNSNLLYTACFDSVNQYNLSSADPLRIAASKVTIIAASSLAASTIQQGPDRTLYVATGDRVYAMAYPDTLGTPGIGSVFGTSGAPGLPNIVAGTY